MINMKRCNTKIRASSLPALFDCAAYFEAKQLRGMTMPATGKSILGRAVHASTAVYDVSRIMGGGIKPNDAAGAAVDVIWKPDEEVNWGEDLNPQMAENIAVSLHRLYCEKIAPETEYAGVEVTCEGLTITDLNLTITGTVDRVYTADDFGCTTYGIADIKTGSRAVSVDGKVNTSGHMYQMGVYELLAEQAIGRPITAPAQIIGLQAGKKAKGQRAAKGQICNAKQVLVGDNDRPGILEMAAKMLHSGIFYGNPRSILCHSAYCPIFKTCYFRR